MQNTLRQRKLGPKMSEHLRFLGGFLRGPASVGALTPSSRFLAEAMVEGCGLEDADTVVELGPGTGAFTRTILDRIGKDTTFFAMERDRIFAVGLKRRFPHLVVYNDSAECLRDYLARHGKERADYILSGLPWAALPFGLQERILDAITKSLPAGGVFTTFQYLHARLLPNALRFRKLLLARFRGVRKSRVVWKNVPPAFVYRCTK